MNEHLARVARRESAARSDLLDASHGAPLTPELTDEQVLIHARWLITRARVIYEVWRNCSGPPIPQPLSVEIMRFRSACESATAVFPEEVANAES
jgi:hypothetical protein